MKEEVCFFFRADVFFLNSGSCQALEVRREKKKKSCTTLNLQPTPVLYALIVL